MKRNILILAIVGIALPIIGFVLLHQGAGFGSILEDIGYLLSFIAWILALVATARIGRWGWFILVLLLSWLFMIPLILYGIIGPTARKA